MKDEEIKIWQQVEVACLQGTLRNTASKLTLIGDKF
jgi:hypothetical protein